MQQNPTDPDVTGVPVYDRGTGRSPWRDRLVAGALCLVVGAAGGFLLGRATASPGPATLAEAFQLAQEGGPSVQGAITSVDGDVLTVSTQAGELKVQLTGSTEILRAVAGKAADLAAGDRVSVRLDTTASNGGSGTVTAASVTEEPGE